jgi:hypothetical protein
MTDPAPAAEATGPAAEQQALEAALRGLVEQVARLAVARGLAAAPVQEMLRLAFVRAAAAAHPGLAEHRKTSRIATTTGLNRREVARLQAALAQPADHSAPRSSPATQLFLLWTTDAAWLDAAGQPRVLPRLGLASDGRPGFEALAQHITRDVHPRSLLDELVRLGLVHWDAGADTVAVLAPRFTAQGDRVRQLGLLGDNVGDHLRAAVDNVLAGSDTPAAARHLEQAVFAWGLTPQSIAALQPVLREQWQALARQLVPLLRERVQADAEATPEGHTPPGRLRVGLYAYHEGAEAAVPAAAPALPRRAARRRAPAPPGDSRED